jgi:hypothetical protein
MNHKPLVDWMRERQLIYRRKEYGYAPPYTADPILRDFRFCNVFRELDKVTIWIRDNWRIPYAEHSNLCFAMGIARFFNKPNTLEYIGFPDNDGSWDQHEVMRILEEVQHVEGLFSAAYIISPSGSTKPKFRRVVEDYLVPFFPYAEQCIVDNSLELTWKNICQYEGFGKFMAYEVVSDLRWTPRLMHSPDIYTWANAGPGAKRGLNWLLGQPLKTNIPEDQMVALMQYLIPLCESDLKGEDPMFDKLEMRDIEHSLCETDKYLRTKNGLGRPKQGYP